MSKRKPENLRSVALAGHGDSGKTSLAEALLFEAKATKRLGSVDEGTSILDSDPEEKARRFSIDSAIAHCTWKGKEINLVDTPGYPDFIAEMISSLIAVDTVLITLSAPKGVELNARRAWDEAGKARLARMVLINKMDSENIKFEELLTEIREVLGKECVLLYVPIGTGEEFSGLANLLDGSRDEPTGALTDVAGWREALMERIVEADDALLERYLDGEQIPREELQRALVRAVASGKVVPILCSSVRKGIGIREVLDTLAEFAPSPLEGKRRIARRDGEEKEIDPSPEAPFSGQVFKVVSDPFVGKMCYFRVFGGRISQEGTFYDASRQRECKFGGLLRPQGKETSPISEAVAGDIVAVSKVEELQAGDTLGRRDSEFLLPWPEFPNPMVTLAVRPKSRGGEQRISGGLSRIAESDPTFLVEWNRETREQIISGMSTLHLEVVLSRLRRRFEVDVETAPPKIPYKETISRAAEGHYRHKKQTGGHGQYGEVYLKVEPLPRGGGFEFVDEIVGGAIPRQYIPAVEKGVREALQKGVIAGFPVVDIRVRVYDGTYHEVDSSEASFKIAAAKALQEALSNGKPVLIEPIVKVEISVPNEYMGQATGDLNSRRARIFGMDSSAGMQIIRAEVPLAEVKNYATELRSMTGGAASYTMEFSRYEVVPARLAEQVVSMVKEEQKQGKD